MKKKRAPRTFEPRAYAGFTDRVYPALTKRDRIYLMLVENDYRRSLGSGSSGVSEETNLAPRRRCELAFACTETQISAGLMDL